MPVWFPVKKTSLDTPSRSALSSSAVPPMSQLPDLGSPSHPHAKSMEARNCVTASCVTLATAPRGAAEHSWVGMPRVLAAREMPSSQASAAPAVVR